MNKYGENDRGRNKDDMEIYVFGNWVEISFIFKTENRRIGLELKMH